MATTSFGLKRLLRASPLAILVVTSTHPALAQSAIERHTVPVPIATGQVLRLDQPSYASDDMRPYGVKLAGVQLLGETATISSHPSTSMSVAGAPLPGADPDDHGGLRAALAAALGRDIGEPLSPHVVADLQASVAAVYRAHGLPFVSVTVPPQEITAGVVQLRVILFRAGKIGVKPSDDNAAGDQDAANVRAGVRLQRGETIDARQLSEDIDWLNRTPYRHVTGTFSPGEATALSNLTLELDAQKPWSVQAGWSNSGTTATGLERYSLGAGVFLPSLNGISASYLLTGGSNFWADPGRFPLANGNYPQYLSQSARLVIPTFARQQIEFTPDLVAQRQMVDANTPVENLVVELPLIYRSAISNFLPQSGLGDVYGGAELKYLQRRVYFYGAEYAHGRAGLLQYALGWSNTIPDALGQTAIDLKLEINPGTSVANSSDAAWAAYSNGRVTHAAYSYAILNLTRHTDLPQSFAWVSAVTAVGAGRALPDTERLALGGSAGSRGYSFADVSVDRGAIWRNELRLPPVRSIRAAKDLPLDLALSPYLFADAAWGQDIATRHVDWLVSLGSGVDLAFTDYITGSLTAGRAMTATPTTPIGSWTVLANLNLKF